MTASLTQCGLCLVFFRAEAGACARCPRGLFRAGLGCECCFHLRLHDETPGSDQVLAITNVNTSRGSLFRADD